MDDETTLFDMRLLRFGSVVAAVGAATLTYAAVVERNLFTLRRYDVPVLAPDAEPLRVLHLSDLHLTPGRRRLADWVGSLAALDPDLVVVTGDNLGGTDAVPAAIRALQPLFDYPGAFVFGSNDYRGPVWKNPFSYFDRDRDYVQGVELPWGDLRDVLLGIGWRDLNNARATLTAGGRSIELVGVDDPHIGQDDYGTVVGPVSSTAAVALGLTHTPEPRVLDAMAMDGFNLLLAGHTHGGQVRVPGVGALVTNCGLDRRMARGLHRWPGPAAPGAASGAGPTWLHVSAGLGTHPTAPIRFACLPEASILTLIPR